MCTAAAVRVVWPALQAYLLITKVPDGGGRYNTPPSLILAAWTAYKAAQEASIAAPASELVQVGGHHS